MGRTYTATASIATVTTAKTLLYITAPTGGATLLYASVTNADNDTAEQMEVSFTRITSLGTPTATSVTPAEHESAGQAAQATVAANVTASEPTYASVPFSFQGVSSLAGYYWMPREKERVLLLSGESAGIQLVATIASTTLLVELTFEE